MDFEVAYKDEILALIEKVMKLFKDEGMTPDLAEIGVGGFGVYLKTNQDVTPVLLKIYKLKEVKHISKLYYFGTTCPTLNVGLVDGLYNLEPAKLKHPENR